MPSCNKTDVFEGNDVGKISALVVTIGIFYIKDFHFHKLSLTVFMIY